MAEIVQKCRQNKFRIVGVFLPGQFGRLNGVLPLTHGLAVVFFIAARTKNCPDGFGWSGRIG